MLETVMTIFVVGVLALAFIFTMTRGILQVSEEHVEKEKLRVKRLESEVKTLENDRKRQESDADRTRFA